MVNARPELIFVKGPQAGERAVMMTNTVLVGRSPTADVRLQEVAASREQVRFELTPDGWLMENLSANGTLINGKRYKKKKRLLLETGDTLGMGLETEVLYVAPGDDPETAVAAHRQVQPPAEPPKPKAEDEAPKPAAATKPPPAPTQTPAPAAVTPAPAARSHGHADRDQAKAQAGKEGAKEGEGIVAQEEAKGKKLKVILCAVVVVCMVVFGLVLILKSGEEDGPRQTGLPRLTAEQIVEALSAPLARSPSPTKAADELNKAVHSYNNRTLWEPGDLYRCVKSFKLHRAYRQSPTFDAVQHEQMADKAEKELEKLVCDKCDSAWKFEKAGEWRNAKAAFEELLRILPVAELDHEGPIYEKIIKGNVIPHLNYIKQHVGKVRGF